MRIRFQGLAVLALAMVALAALATACGGDDEKDKGGSDTISSAPTKGPQLSDCE
jgi:hypothetical protein